MRQKKAGAVLITVGVFAFAFYTGMLFNTFIISQDAELHRAAGYAITYPDILLWVAGSLFIITGLLIRKRVNIEKT